ncbi:MAG: hypothetical protein IJX39_01595 [Clostridia bacterium]|nr:hypothetical protein [Clostridia bacterium]
MNDKTRGFCLQYALRRTEILRIADRFADALDEDRTQNADMFDTARTAFSASRHPNATMRALEEEFRTADETLLCLLVALCDAGMELVLALSPISSPTAFAEMASDIFDRLEQERQPSPRMAQKLTEIKAEHAVRRLNAAITQMNQCIK